MTKRKVEVEESAEYDNFIGEVDKSSLPSSLGEFMGDDAIQEDVDIDKWRQHWKGMPSFTNEDNEPFKRVIMSFRTEKDYLEFQQLIGQKMTNKTKSAWHPKLDITANALTRWMDDE